MREPVFLELGCLHCGVKQCLDLFDWDPDRLVLVENEWECPS